MSNLVTQEDELDKLADGIASSLIHSDQHVTGSVKKRYNQSETDEWDDLALEQDYWDDYR